MAYEDEPRTYELQFADYPGLEVTAAEPSLEEMLELIQLSEETRTADGTRKVMQAFAKHLKSWNVTRQGKPVPATYAGLMGRSAGFINAMTEGFIEAVIGVPKSSPGTSGGTAASPGLSAELAEASIPMTPSQPSQGS